MCLKGAAAFAALLWIALLVIGQYQKEHLAGELSEKIIRFHVRANSDSPKDQELKLLVRDAIGTYMGEELEDASDIAEGRRILLRDMEEVKRRASQVLAEEGYDYEVSVSLGTEKFPEKSYGDYTFPPGEYEALQVVIGQGKGKNWWCVMYPNMCFRGSVYEVVEEEAEDSLREILTAEEYDAVMKSDNRELHFRWLPFLERFFSCIFALERVK